MAKAKTAFVCNDCGADFRNGRANVASATPGYAIRNPFERAGKGAGGRPLALVMRARWLAATGGCGGCRFVETGSGFDELIAFKVALCRVRVLIGGHPGAGKNMLLLQTLCLIAEGHPALYVTGESPEQIAMRANRLGLLTDALQLMAETDVDAILASADALKPRYSWWTLYRWYTARH